MPTLYPLRFEPLFRRYIWGGRRLETVLGKSLGEGGDYAESWEIVDRNKDQSVVVAGPLAGNTLGQLVADQGAELFGRHHPQRRFPLMLKFLDANRKLSVQVHPDDAQAARLNPPDLGKSEAWVILAARPGSVVYAGLRRGFDRAALKRDVARQTTHLCLNRLEPKVGDCIYLPSRTVHALGEGLLVAELQQASDTTFRLFDWNRAGAEGKPRPLHVSQALETIDYAHGPVRPQVPQPTAHPHVSRLVDCEKFVLDRWEMDQPQIAGGDDRFHILAVLEGEVGVQGDPSSQPLSLGHSLLLPASAGEVHITPSRKAVLLDAYLP